VSRAAHAAAHAATDQNAKVVRAAEAGRCHAEEQLKALEDSLQRAEDGQQQLTEQLAVVTAELDRARASARASARDEVAESNEPFSRATAAADEVRVASEQAMTKHVAMTNHVQAVEAELVACRDEMLRAVDQQTIQTHKCAHAICINWFAPQFVSHKCALAHSSTCLHRLFKPTRAHLLLQPLVLVLSQ
jgi:hypothetical protein